MNFRDWYSRLQNLNELHEISHPISPEIQLASVSRYLNRYPKALIFTNVINSRFSVLANGFSSLNRISMAFGLQDWKELFLLGQQFFDNKKKDNLIQYHSSILSEHFDLTNRGLAELPRIINWPEDTAPYISLAVVTTRSPVTNSINSGIYRIEIENDDTAWIYLHDNSGAKEHFTEAINKDITLPVTIAIGAPPALTILSALTLPSDLEELQYASALDPDGLAICILGDFPPIPVDSEIIILGRLLLSNKHGARFGNFTGYYDQYYTKIKLEVCLTGIRKKAVYQTCIVGEPPSETSYMFKTSEALFLPFWRHQAPFIHNVILPVYSGFNEMVIVATDNDSPAPEIFEQLRHLDPPISQKIICLTRPNQCNNSPETAVQILIQGLKSNNIFCLENPKGTGLDARNIVAHKHRLDIQKDQKLALAILKKIEENSEKYR